MHYVNQKSLDQKEVDFEAIKKSRQSSIFY